ncbi:hydrogen peroxide-inducible genes activator [uncultured Roseobacter sp.]|uniref:hydrogen peroxide-inducible genes activator n=1 Tax=uncultured Roseobacter sp. TaxID=114847 RepID=UPI0026186254|nr:hydrogen peroxide-inducible genes activator [uncultured Roseobacter sp.]
MENFTIKQLRYFEAVALHGHFGRAAEACSISQPAISVQIKELEETLGQLLFERHARHIRLTSFGEEFAQRVRPILRSIDDLSDLARASQAGLIGKLRLGIIPTVGPYLLPRLVADLNNAYPRLDLRIRETQTENLIFDLLGGQLDVALVALPISEPGLTEVPLFDESFVLVRSLSDAEKPVPSSETLSKMRLLLLEEGHCFRDQALAFCGTPSNLPRESMEGSSLSTLVQMVASGLGVTLIPEMAVALETRSADVSVAHFKRPEPTRTIGMVWRKSTPLADQLTGLAGRVKQTVTG